MGRASANMRWRVRRTLFVDFSSRDEVCERVESFDPSGATPMIGECTDIVWFLSIGVRCGSGLVPSCPGCLSFSPSGRDGYVRRLEPDSPFQTRHGWRFDWWKPPSQASRCAARIEASASVITAYPPRTPMAAPGAPWPRFVARDRLVSLDFHQLNPREHIQ